MSRDDLLPEFGPASREGVLVRAFSLRQVLVHLLAGPREMLMPSCSHGAGQEETVGKVKASCPKLASPPRAALQPGKD